MSRRLYTQDSGTSSLTGAVGTSTASSTQVNTNNDQVAITVTLNQSTSTDTINTTKIVASTGIIQYLTAMNNLILMNEIPEESTYDRDTTIYLKDQIGFYFKYQITDTNPVEYGFMGFINNSLKK
jgi:hypothetical protein